MVDMKFFWEFSFAEIAALENLSERTVERRWEKARIYLHQNIRADLPL
jgi:DNA-directed RNA polymerase specialized sigma24 family protein